MLLKATNLTLIKSLSSNNNNINTKDDSPNTNCIIKYEPKARRDTVQNIIHFVQI